MNKTVLFLVIAAALADGLCYTLAKWPERERKWWSILPGSGFVALLVIGRR